MPDPTRSIRNQRRILQQGTFAASQSMARTIAGPTASPTRLLAVQQRILRNESIGRRGRGGKAFDAGKFKRFVDSSRSAAARKTKPLARSGSGRRGGGGGRRGGGGGGRGRVARGSLTAGDSFLFGAGSGIDPVGGRFITPKKPVNLRNLLNIRR